MSGLRGDTDRGPAAGHLLDRFSTTYTANYRSFDDTQKNLPSRCLPGSKTNSVVTNSQFGAPYKPLSDRPRPNFNSTNFATSTIRNGAPTGNQPMFNLNSRIDHVNARRAHDHPDPINDDLHRRKLHNLGIHAFSSNRLPATTGASTNHTPPHTGTTSNKNYTSTYTTTVAGDKLNPCFTRDSNCDKGVQAVGSAGFPQARINLSSKFDNSEKKVNGVSPTTNTTTTQPNYKFDFGQMFNQIARINNHLYLSSLNALSPERLRQYGITLLVSVMIDPPPIYLRNAVPNSMHISVEDTDTAYLQPHFDRVADCIAAEQRRGGKALVHCVAGVSRSSTLVLAYLMRHMNMSLADAYKHVRAARPCIQPNPGFWRQLLDYEERIYGTRSVRLLPPVSYPVTTMSMNPQSRLFNFNDSAFPRTNYMDLYSRPAGDLLPYRPLTSLYSADPTYPFIGCRR